MNKTDFAEWEKEVDRECWRIIGVGKDDLPDWLYADAYAKGMTACQAARAAIEAVEDDLLF